MTISTTSHDALHSLLHISLTTDPALARVVFRTSANYDRIAIDLHIPGSPTEEPEMSWWIMPYEAETVLAEVRACLSPENLAALAAQKRAARVTALEQQLADARKEIA